MQFTSDYLPELDRAEHGPLELFNGSSKGSSSQEPELARGAIAEPFCRAPKTTDVVPRALSEFRGKVHS